MLFLSLLAATSPSPFGSTCSQLGCSSGLANPATLQPLAASGLPPSGQPIAVAMLTVGISDECGGGNSGSRPLPSATVSCAVVPQAARPNIIADSISVFARIKHSGREISISVNRCPRADPTYAAGIGRPEGRRGGKRG